LIDLDSTTLLRHLDLAGLELRESNRFPFDVRLADDRMVHPLSLSQKGGKSENERERRERVGASGEVKGDWLFPAISHPVKRVSLAASSARVLTAIAAENSSARYRNIEWARRKKARKTSALLQD
jgi:hypothetical protein